LWLDSFDVHLGDVWRVAFLADNPGMWANQCHNLAHAAAGMTPTPDVLVSLRRQGGEPTTGCPTPLLADERNSVRLKAGRRPLADVTARRGGETYESGAAGLRAAPVPAA
jgi:Multicopper oxidase